MGMEIVCREIGRPRISERMLRMIGRMRMQLRTGGRGGEHGMIRGSETDSSSGPSLCSRRFPGVQIFLLLSIFFLSIFFFLSFFLLFSRPIHLRDGWERLDVELEIGLGHVRDELPQTAVLILLDDGCTREIPSLGETKRCEALLSRLVQTGREFQELPLQTPEPVQEISLRHLVPIESPEVPTVLFLPQELLDKGPEFPFSFPGQEIPSCPFHLEMIVHTEGTEDREGFVPGPFHHVQGLLLDRHP